MSLMAAIGLADALCLPALQRRRAAAAVA